MDLNRMNERMTEVGPNDEREAKLAAEYGWTWATIEVVFEGRTYTKRILVAGRTFILADEKTGLRRTDVRAVVRYRTGSKTHNESVPAYENADGTWTVNAYDRESRRGGRTVYVVGMTEDVAVTSKW